MEGKTSGSHRASGTTAKVDSMVVAELLRCQIRISETKMKLFFVWGFGDSSFLDMSTSTVAMANRPTLAPKRNAQAFDSD